ncbi:MAG: hypothetical protein GY799_15930 [Desulfobulbaceae bacterium]|nr:hypothetical protein [Desulfobulbaceae bacterium]
MPDIFEIAKEESMEEEMEGDIPKDTRGMVIDALKERFFVVPADIRNKVCSFKQHDVLKELLRYAIRSSDIDEFKTALLKIAKEEIMEESRLKEARDMLTEALSERFETVPADIRDKVHSFGQYDVLRELLRRVIRSSDIDEFKTVLSKVLSVP